LIEDSVKYRGAGHFYIANLKSIDIIFSMIIKIDDNINPEERKRLLITIPVMYAIWKCDENLTAASNFLGISLRCLRNRMSLYPELRAFKGEMVDEVHQKYFNIT